MNVSREVIFSERNRSFLFRSVSEMDDLRETFIYANNKIMHEKTPSHSQKDTGKSGIPNYPEFVSTMNIMFWNSSRLHGSPADHSATQYSFVHWGLFLLAPLVVFGIAGNILVILAISLEKRLQNVTNYFLLSLAVTDLLVSVIVMPLSIVNELTGRWQAGQMLCNLFVTADVLMCTSSILHMCTISLERYIGIRWPLWSKNKSKWTAFFKIVMVWTFALAISSPITVLGGVSRHNIQQDGHCVLANAHFIIYGSIFAFFIPLIIMVIMYILTIRMLNHQAQMCSNGKLGSSKKLREYTKKYPSMRRSTCRRHWSRGINAQNCVVGKLDVPADVITFAPSASNVSQVANVQHHMLTPTRSCQTSKSKDDPAILNEVHRKGKRIKYNHNNQGQKSNSHLNDTPLECNETMHCNGNGGMHDIRNVEDSPEDKSIPLNNWSGEEWVDIDPSLCETVEKQPKRLTDLVRKHCLAANLLLLRKDAVGREVKNPSSTVKTEQKASNVLGVVFIIFVMCWAPFFVVNIMTVLCQTCRISPTLVTVFVWLGYVSSTLNPIIYTIFNKIFKMTFIKLLFCRYGLLNHNRNSRCCRHYDEKALTCLTAPSSIAAVSMLCTVRTEELPRESSSMVLHPGGTLDYRETGHSNALIESVC